MNKEWEDKYVWEDKYALAMLRIAELEDMYEGAWKEVDMLWRENTRLRDTIEELKSGQRTG